jgi:altronate dehydratase large subunit
MEILGYQRPNGEIGIRNRILVIYTVVCAEEICRKLVNKVSETSLVGWRSCQFNPYATERLIRLGCHPNIGGVLVVAHGCESTDANEIYRKIAEQGKPVQLMTIQEVGGNLYSIREGIRLIEELKAAADVPRVPLKLEDLIVGLECGGSDTTSGLAANPAVGWAADQFVAQGGRVIFEEAGEMWGCEIDVMSRASDPQVRDKIELALERTKEWANTHGIEMFASGNLEGGLTNIFEKSIGALIKTGSSPIIDVLDGLKGDRLQKKPGAYLLDAAYYRGEKASGTTDESDPIGVTEMVAAGAHIVIFTTGRGSVVGSGIAPVIKVCGNPKTYERMKDNMDINAGEILTGTKTIQQVGEEIYQRMIEVAAGHPTQNEILEHFEFHI